jgi:hypothetical protein
MTLRITYKSGSFMEWPDITFNDLFIILVREVIVDKEKIDKIEFK